MRFLSSALLAGVSLAPPALAGDETPFLIPYIRDFDMPVSNWQAYVNTGSFGGFGFSTGQAQSGGNFGPYRSINQFSSGGPAAGMTIHTSIQTWTPIIRGPIGYLHMTVDVNCFDGGTSNAVAFGFVIVQAGTVYFGPNFTALTNSGWRDDLRYQNLTASSFSSADSEHPDFSPSGGLLAFGFYTSNGTGNSTPINSYSGVDNFFISLATTTQTIEPCGTADIGSAAGLPGPDGSLDNNDFIAFIDFFFSASGAADYGAAGGMNVPDGQLDNNDFIAFINRFFDGCA